MSVTQSPVLDPAEAADATAAARFARVLPLAFVSYALAYLDRVNYGYAEARGLSASLKMSPELGALVPALFFIGYTLFQIPGAAYAARRSAKRLVFWALVLWGFLSAAQGLLTNVPLFVTARVLLGVVESVVFPGMLVFLTHWFTRRERSRANTLLIVGNPLTMACGSAVSGFVIQYFDVHSLFGLQGWQMMFVVEGLPSVLWAFVWWRLADDRPSDAMWLSAEQARAVQARLEAEQQGIRKMDYRTAFCDRRVLLLCAMYLCWSVGTYGFVFWLPRIVKLGSGQGIAATGLLSSIPYFLAIATMLAVSFESDRRLERKAFIWTAMLGGAAAFGLAWLAGDHFWGVFAALVLAGAAVYTPCGPLWAWMAEMVPRNVAGESMALVNTAGALGGFFGSWLVGALANKFHGNGPGFLFMGASLAVAAGCCVCVRRGAER